MIAYIFNKLGLFKEPEDAWKKKYPEISKKIDEMELRLTSLESKNGTKIIRQKKEK